MPRKVFTAGEVLAAADVNSFLMDQAVMTFTDSTARTSAIGTATEGMLTYLADTNDLEVFDGSSFVNIIPAPTAVAPNLVSTTKTDTFSSSSGSLTNITGLSATITPSSATSKVLVVVTIGQVDANGTDRIIFGLTRAGTQIGQGDAAGSRARASSIFAAAADFDDSTAFSFLDSPASTSALTYQVQGAIITTGTFFVNRSNSDGDSGGTGRASSTITVTEVTV